MATAAVMHTEQQANINTSSGGWYKREQQCEITAMCSLSTDTLNVITAQQTAVSMDGDRRAAVSMRQPSPLTATHLSA